MAALVLSIAGAAAGSSVLGPIGAIVGRLVGAVAGKVIDQALFGARRSVSLEGRGFPISPSWPRPKTLTYTRGQKESPVEAGPIIPIVFCALQSARVTALGPRPHRDGTFRIYCQSSALLCRPVNYTLPRPHPGSGSC